MGHRTYRQARVPRREEYVGSPILQRSADVPVLQNHLLREPRPGESQFDIGRDARRRDAMIHGPFSGNPGQEPMLRALGGEVLEKISPNEAAPKPTQRAAVEGDPQDRTRFLEKAHILDRPLAGPAGHWLSGERAGSAPR